MMEYEQILEGWLEDATLFHKEPSDYNFNFDLLQKTNNEVERVTDFIDLPWFDEKVDLSILEDPKNIQLSESDLNELLSIIGSNSDNSYLSSEIQNPTYFDVNFDLTELPGPAASPEEPADFPFSPETSDISSPSEYLYSPDCELISEAGSPASYDSVDEAICNELSLSPNNIYSPDSPDPTIQQTVPAVFVTVCPGEESSSSEITEALSIEEVSKSVRNRRFVNNGKEIPKVHVNLKNNFHPYSKSSSRRGSNKAERKKVQNKEAAARYRIKKRIEEKGLSDEIAGLEDEQKNLKSKHNDLETEIKYLKKLMREVLQKRGII